MGKILVTGAAGFIGYNLCELLLNNGLEVIGIDNFSQYYDVVLKKTRCKRLLENEKFTFVEIDIEDKKSIEALFHDTSPEVVVHLAAQAGVRYSIEFPDTYVGTNINGTFNLVEACQKIGVKHFMFASTSSVYGSNLDMPFRETQKADTQMSLYAATKKSGEVILHSYSHIWNIPTTVFRFFTVYGPWGRPDMALFKFTNAILRGEAIDVYNYGKMSRDFTYVGDLVHAIHLLMDNPPTLENSQHQTVENINIQAVAPYRVVNIGNSHPISLMQYIGQLEKELGRDAKKNFMELQQGDVPETYADTSYLETITGYKPNTSIEVGIKKFVDWYLEYYNDK